MKNHLNIIKRLFSVAVLIAIIFIFRYFISKHEFLLNGETMGTSYNISAWSHKKIDKKLLENETNKILNFVNSETSTWDDISTISKFNRLKKNEKIKVSSFFLQMLKESFEINSKSNKAYDITIFPIVELWGFHKNKELTPPNKKEIEQILKNSGMDKIKITDSYIYKTNSQTKIDLSSIAKGGAIDLIAKKIESLNINNYLIEIGGEIKAKGKNIQNKDWNVGIENPTILKQNKKLITEIVTIKNKAIATSGNYKNFYIENEKLYSHLINPSSGNPVLHNTASVSVISNNASTADAWATALNVIGGSTAISLANKHNIAAMIIIKENKKIKKFYSLEWITYNKKKEKK